MSIQQLKFAGLKADPKDGQKNGGTANSFKVGVNDEGGIESFKGFYQTRDLANTIPTNDAQIFGVYPFSYNTVVLTQQSSLPSSIVCQNIVLADDSFIYISNSTTTKTIYKYNTTDYAFVASITLSGAGGITAMVMDVNYLYVGDAGGTVTRISLLDFTTIKTVSYSLDVISMVVDSNYLYIALGGTVVFGVHRLSLTDFSTETSIGLTNGGTVRMCVNATHLFCFPGAATTTVYRVLLSDFTTTATYDPGNTISDARLDSLYLYLLMGGNPTTVIRLNLSDFSTTTTHTYTNRSSGTRMAINSTYLFCGMTITATSHGAIDRITLSSFATAATEVDLGASKIVQGGNGSIAINTTNLFFKDTAGGDVGVVNIYQRYKIVASTKKISDGTYNFYDISVSGSEVVLTGSPLGTYNDPVSNMISGKLFITSGMDSELGVAYTNGTTATILATVASYQCVHLGRLFVIKKDGTLYWSDVGDGTTFQALNTDNVGPNDNDIASNIVSYNGTLYIHKYHHVYQITGSIFNNVNSTSNYTIIELPSAGCYSRDSFSIFKGNMYYGSKDYGFVISNGTSFEVIHEGTNDIYFTKTATFGWFLTTQREILMAIGKYNVKENEFFPYVQVPTFAYRLLSVANSGYVNYYIVGNRYLYQLDYSYTVTSEAHIDEWYSDWLCFGDDVNTKGFNRIYFDLERTGAWNLYVDVFLDFNTTSVKTLTISLDQTQNILKYIRRDLGLVGTWIRFRFYSGAVNQNFTINTAYVDVSIKDSGRKPLNV